MNTLHKIAVVFLGILSIYACTPKEQTGATVNEEVVTTTKKTIILAVDGGGIKGIIPAMFLDTIEKSLGKSSYQLFDLIGGTSTGGIIAAALTSKNNTSGQPFSSEQIVDIYKNDGKEIFVPNTSWCATCASYYTDHKGKGIEPYLRNIVGATSKLSDNYTYIQSLPSARVQQMFTTSYIVNSTGGKIANPQLNKDYGPYLFNWYDANNNPQNDHYIWEAARGTSAAPTYFPIANVGGGKGFRSKANEKWVVDGGVMSNDPAVWGITEAMRTGIAKRLEDIIVISLGTGFYAGDAGVGTTNQGSTIPDRGDWGPTPWIGKPIPIYNLEEAKTGSLFNVILDAVQLVSNSQLEALQAAGLTYYRLEPSLNQKQSQMDDISKANIDSLIKTTEDYLKHDGKSIFQNIISDLAKN